MTTNVERIVRVWVLDQIPHDFKSGASIGALTRRYGLTREMVEYVIRHFMRRPARARVLRRQR